MNDGEGRITTAKNNYSSNREAILHWREPILSPIKKGRRISPIMKARVVLAPILHVGKNPNNTKQFGLSKFF